VWKLLGSVTVGGALPVRFALLRLLLGSLQSKLVIRVRLETHLELSGAYSAQTLTQPETPEIVIGQKMNTA
jgi:hypothetical protein